MKAALYRTYRAARLMPVFVIAMVLWCLPVPAQSAIVTQLDITGGSISLDFGSLGTLAGNFTQNGRLVMGQHQTPPTVFAPITIGHATFSFVTQNGGTLNLPPPSAQISGAGLTADLRSLVANVTSANTGWQGVLSGPSTPLNHALHIGGTATGSFDERTNAFDLSWTSSFTGISGLIPELKGGTFALQGTAQLAAVPVPAAAWLFGSGMIGLAGLIRRNTRNQQQDQRGALNETSATSWCHRAVY